MLEVFVWVWSLVWWFAEDAAKVLCRYVVNKNNIFDINNDGVMVLTPGALKEQELMREAAKNPSAGHH